jgi:hypothetical protein
VPNEALSIAYSTHSPAISSPLSIISINRSYFYVIQQLFCAIQFQSEIFSGYEKSFHGGKGVAKVTQQMILFK